MPDHVRSLTCSRVLQVEADLTMRLATRAEQYGRPVRIEGPTVQNLDPAQRSVVGALASPTSLIVIEGAAGAGKTATLAAARAEMAQYEWRLVVVTPTLKAAHVAEEQVGADAFSAAWLIYQHGYRWDDDGHWTRVLAHPEARAQLRPGDLLLIDEVGMVDQDTALALLTIADEARARIAFVGDRHQLPAVGRGGVLDHAAQWARPDATLTLETVHRFIDPDYADLTLRMRTGERAGAVFDSLFERGQVRIYPTDVERLAALTKRLTNGLTITPTRQSTATDERTRLIADTREQVTALNAAIRDQHLAAGQPREVGAVITAAGDRVGPGDQITTRRNNRELGGANRDAWRVTAIDDTGAFTVSGRAGRRALPADYVHHHVELAYATTVHGVQGETVDHAHLLIGETTGAAAASPRLRDQRLEADCLLALA